MLLLEALTQVYKMFKIAEAPAATVVLMIWLTTGSKEKPQYLRRIKSSKIWQNYGKEISIPAPKEQELDII